MFAAGLDLQAAMGLIGEAALCHRGKECRRTELG